MHIDIDQALLPLPGRTPLRLPDAFGSRLRSEAGTLWITFDHDHRDLVLEPGQSLVVDSHQPVMVTALGGRAVLGLCAAPAGGRAAAGGSRVTT